MLFNIVVLSGVEAGGRWEFDAAAQLSPCSGREEAGVSGGTR